MLTRLARISGALCARLLVAGVAAAAIIFAPVAFSSDQQPAAQEANKQDTKKKDEGKVPTEQELEQNRKNQQTAKPGVVKLSPVESVVEIAIIAYGGRQQLQTVRGAIHEEGTIRLASAQGDLTGTYNMRSIRGEKSSKDLLRIDLGLMPPEAVQRQGAGQINYVIAFNGASVWSAQNNQYVTPGPDAEAAFRAQLTHDYSTLLRYKEDGSKIELVGPETVVGVVTNVVDLTTPEGDKTRFWISAKTYRVIHAEYELKLAESQTPTKYRISYFYTPYRVVQNTLVPTRRVMNQDGKFAQEIIINRAIYSAKLAPEIFQHLQEQ